MDANRGASIAIGSPTLGKMGLDLDRLSVWTLKIARKVKPYRTGDVGVRSISPEIGLGLRRLAFSLFRVQRRHLDLVQRDFLSVQDILQ